MAVPSGAAQDDEPTGDITLHDTEDGEATNESFCDFWIRGTGFSEQEVRLIAAHELDGPSAHQHELGNVTGEPDDNGTFAFLAGPFTLHETDDEWRIIAIVHPEGEEFDRSVDGEELDYLACDFRPSPATPPDCTASTLTAEARADGSVFLDWDPVPPGGPEPDFYAVHRTEAGGGETVELAQTSETSFTDTTAIVGTTYTYHVDAHLVLDDNETTSTGCGSAQVTAIPFFGAAGAAFAAVAAIGAYAMVRRRA